MKKVVSSLVLSVVVASLIYLLSTTFYHMIYDKIDNAYMEVTILDNGDLRVREVVSYLNNKNNVISIPPNNNKKEFIESDINSYKDSSIYNYDYVEIISLNEIDKYSTNFNELNKNKLNYEVKDNTYTFDSKYVYIEYILKNYAVLHSDTAELLFSIKEAKEINNIEIVFNIPNNQNKLSYYLHSSKDSLTDSLDKIDLTMKNIKESSIRLVFDKEVIKNSTKVLSDNALSNISKIEKQISDDIENTSKINSYKNIIGIILDVLKTIWLAVTIFMLMRTYLKYDKEFNKKFKRETVDTIPNDMKPYEVEYLVSGQITQKSIKSIILSMIKDGKLSIKKHEDTYLIKTTKKELDNDEEYLVNVFFNAGVINVKDLKNNKHETFSEHTYKKLLKRYYTKSIENNYYIDSSKVKKLLVLYSFVGIVLNFISYLFTYNEVIMLMIYLVSLTTMIYFLLFKKKKKKGNEAYAKWIAYKNHLVSDDDHSYDAYIYGNVLGVLPISLEKSDFIEFSDMLFDTNILRNDFSTGKFKE